jgi:hypothetical protein
MARHRTHRAAEKQTSTILLVGGGGGQQCAVFFFFVCVCKESLTFSFFFPFPDAEAAETRSAKRSQRVSMRMREFEQIVSPHPEVVNPSIRGRSSTAGGIVPRRAALADPLLDK